MNYFAIFEELEAKRQPVWEEIVTGTVPTEEWSTCDHDHELTDYANKHG